MTTPQGDADLGTARGHIQIDAEVNVRSAEDGLNRVRERAANLESQLSETGRRLELIANRLSALGRQASDAARDLARTAAAMGATGAAAASSIASVTGLSRALDEVRDSANGASRALGTLMAMRTASGALGVLTEKALGLDKAIQSMGRGFASTFATITAFRGLTATVDALGRRIGYAALSTTAFAGASRGILRLPQIWRVAALSVAAYGASLGDLSGRMGQLFRSAEGISGFAGLNGLANRLGMVSRAFRSVSGSAENFRSRMDGMAGSGRSPLAGFAASLVRDADKVVKSIGTLMLSMAIFKKSRDAWNQYSPKLALGFDGLTYASVGLKALSNGIMNVVDALGQLSKSALMIPGIVASLGAIGVVGKIAFKGLGEAIKAGMSSAADFSKNMKDVPDELKGLARVIQSYKTEIDSLQGVAIKSVFGKNIERDAKALLSSYIPLLKVGFEQVGDGINFATRGLTNFFNSARGRSLVSSIFGSSGNTAQYLGRALQPAVDAMLTLAKVGAEAFSSLTFGAEGAANRFRDFIVEAQQTGRLRQWMDDGVEGMRDLYRGTRDLAKGLSGMFSSFSDHSGEDALKRYANAMANFRKNISAAPSTGWLRQVTDFVNRLAGDGRQVLEAFGREIGGVVQAFKPFALAVSEAFAEKHLIEIKLLAAAITAFFNTLNAIPGLSTLIGYMISFGVTAKILRFALVPLIAIGGQLISVFMGLRTAAAAMTVFGAAMTMAGTQATGWRARMGTMAGGVVGSLGRVTSFLLGPWGIALAAAGAAVYKLIDAQSKMKQAMDDSEAYRRFETQSRSVYGKALATSVGDVKDEGFKNTAQSQIENLRKEMEKAKENRPDFWAGLTSTQSQQEGGVDTNTPEQQKFLEEKGYSGRTYQYGKLNDEANRAEGALKAFDAMKVSNEDMATAVTGSKAAYDNLIASFRSGVADQKITQDQFNLAKEALDKQRKAFEEAQAAFNRQTPGLASLAQGLKLIGAAGDDSTQKLKGLKLALDGLFGTNNALDAAIATAEAIKKVGDATSELSLDQGKLAAGFNPATGGLDVANSEVQKLYQALKPIGDDLQNVAANGGNVAEALAKWQPQLDAIRAKSGASEDLWRKMLETARATPNEIVMVMKATGLNETDAWLAAIAIKSKQINGEPIRVAINGQEDIERLKALGATIDTIAGKPNEINVRLSPEALAKMPEEVRKVLASGVVIPAPTTPAKPGQPTQSPVVPAPGQATVPAPGAPATPTTPQGQVQAVQQAAEKIKPQYETMLVVKGSEDSVIVIQRVIDKLNEFRNTKAEITLEIKSNQLVNLPAMVAQLDRIMQGTKISVDLTSLEGIPAKLEEIKNKITEFVEAVKAKLAELVPSFTNLLQPLDGVVNSARGYGERIGQGLADGLASKKGAVGSAAESLAQAINDYVKGRSPTKKGPLSGSGWTTYSGQKIADGLAQGISDGTPNVERASSGMASAAKPSDLALAVQAILTGGTANMEALRKYGLGPTSEETLALADAGKRGVSAAELEAFLKSGDFQSSGLAGKLDPSSETVNNLRKLRENDKLVSDLIQKNHGVLLDPKEEYEKQFKAGRDAADKVTGPFKRAISGLMDSIRGAFGMPLAGISGQRDGQTKYQVDDSISDYEVQRNLAKRTASNIGQNNQLGTALAQASSSLSSANESLSKNQSDIAEAKQKIAEFKPTGDASKDKEAMDSLQKSLKDLEKQTDDLRKAQVKAQNDFGTATQNFQQNGGRTSQIPQLTEAKKAEDEKLAALQEAQKKRTEFKPTEDAAKDAISKRELEKAVSDAQSAYSEAKQTSARLSAAMATTVTPTLTGPGSPTAGSTNVGGQPGSAYGLRAGTNIQYGASGFPPWVYELGKAFNLEASTYAGHQEKGGSNQGIDWRGKPEDMERFAKFLQANPQLVNQTIYLSNSGEKYGTAGGKRVGPGTDQPGYYADDWAGHNNHVHTSFGRGLDGLTVGPAQMPIPTSATPKQVAQSPAPAAGKPVGAPTGQWSQQDIANYIYGSALAQGFNDKQARDFIIQAVGESGLRAGANGGNQDGTGAVGGIFQFTPGTWGNRPGSMWNPKDNVDQYFALAKERGLTPDTFTSGQQLGTQVSKGGPWHPANVGHLSTATANAQQYLQNISANSSLTAANTGVSALGTAPAQNTLESLLAGNADLAALFAKAQDPNLSRQDTAKLLQDLDDYSAKNPNDKALVDARKQQIMSDKGIKEAEGLDLGPVDKGLEVAGKVQNLVDGVLKVVKWPMDVYNSVQNMFDQGGKAFEMLIRGFSGTKDVNDFIDQMQATWGSVLNVFQTVTGIVGTVADVFSTVADVAKTITEIVKTGAEVAGAIAEVAQVVGAIAGVVSGVVGGVAAAVGSVDEIIDMAQEAWKIGSRYIGKALSWIAGGLGGPMQGTVRALYDANDQTLKFWNAENPDMKTTYGLDPFRKNDAPGTNKPLDDQIKNQSTTNIYANPNASAAEIMREQQYAVRTAGLGANQNFD